MLFCESLLNALRWANNGERYTMDQEIQWMDAAKIRKMITDHERQRADLNQALVAHRKPDVTFGQALKFAGMLAVQRIWNRKK